MTEKEKVLQMKTVEDVLAWMKANPDLFDAEIGAYFDRLRKENFDARMREIIPDYDPDTHYDFF